MLESPYDRRRADDEEDAKNIAQVDNGDVAPFGVGLNLVKCAVGAGSFTFPFAFTQTGIVCGIIGIILFAVMAAYTMKLLADAEKKFLMIRDYRPIESPETGKPSRNRLTYPELMRTAYPTAEVFGYNYMAGLLYVTVVLTSLGICVAYVLFITSTMNHGFGWDTDYTVLGLSVPILILAMFKSFKLLAFTSVLGDVAVTAGLIGTIWGGLAAGRTLSWPDNIPAFNSSRGGNVPIGLATLCFMFNIHMMCLPMSQSLKGDMQHPDRFPKVVNISFVFILTLNLIFTLLCVMIFHGDDGGILNPVLRNLNTGAPLQVIRVLLCVDLLFTVPMILAVGREIIEYTVQYCLGMKQTQIQINTSPSVGGWQEDEQRDDGEGSRAYKMVVEVVSRKQMLITTLVRISMVAIVLSISFGAIENSGVNQAFSDVVALIGGVSGSLLGFILPPLLYMGAYKEPGEIGALSRVIMISIVIIGLGLLGSTTYFTAKSMAHS